MEASVRANTLSFGNAKTYLMAGFFVVANVVLPQLFHAVPQGGATWLPIYFFTLIGAYLYGWRVGVLTAVLSPMTNWALFGMPVASVLPAIILKSVILGVAAGYASRRTRGVSILALVAVVAVYQGVGTLGEWALTGDFAVACQDLRLGLPGMALQVLGGYAVLSVLRR